MTETETYPSIVTKKLDAALARVANVHTRFQSELDAIFGQVQDQARLATLSLTRCEALSPLLLSLSEHIQSILELLHRSASLVHKGRDSLHGAVDSINEAIEDIRSRSKSMQDILSISKKIAEKVNRISETAVENKVIAINASITASKASDKVKGFKVIATEITKLSAVMAERVGVIVDKTAHVGQKIALIMEQMDAGIESTGEVLRKVGEAFGLLDHIGKTIEFAAGTTKDMAHESADLAIGRAILEETLSAIQASVASTGKAASVAKNAMERQNHHIATLKSALSDAGSVTHEFSKIQSVSSAEARILRMSEIPMIQYDPALATIVREYHYLNFTCIRLIRYSSNRKLVPYLAETWSLHSDERTWDFHLKDDVYFHDGSQVSADDVKYSIERVLNPKLGSPYANLLSIIEGADAFMRGESDHVCGIKVLGRYHVQFTLKSTFNFFLSLLASSFSAILKKDASLFSMPLQRDQVLSAGPFRSLPKIDQDVDLLTANERFVNGRPFYDTIEIHRAVRDLPEAIVSGRIDFAYNIPAGMERSFLELGFSGEIRRYTSKYCFGLAINFMHDNFLARNAELRRAACMAINKDGIIETVFGKDAVRADSVLAKAILNDGGRHYIPYDPDAARRIVERYRREDDLDKKLTIGLVKNQSSGNLEKTATLICEQLLTVGIKAELELLPESAATVDEYRKFDMMFLRFMPEIDLFSALEPFINPQGGDNYFKYDNPEMLRALNDSIGIKDSAKRTEYFLNLLEKFTLDVFMVPLFFQKVLCLIPPHVHGIFLSPDESFVPDVAFQDSEAKAGVKRNSVDLETDRLFEQYRKSCGGLSRETKTMVETGEALTVAAETTTECIFSQKKEILEAGARIDSFVEHSKRLQETRLSVVESIHTTAEESAVSSQASRIIEKALGRLSTDVGNAVHSLREVKKEIRRILGIVKSIEESNSVIASVAINAAIISSKADTAGNELVKVSQAISELAQGNSENTASILQILQEMEANILEHTEGIETAFKTISGAAKSVGRSGTILDAVNPVLASVETKAEKMQEISSSLYELIETTRESVHTINDASRKVTSSAEVLNFGIALERAVLEILADINWFNETIMEFTTR